MRRRQFITFLGGTAAAWPIVARAQQPGRMRRIGVIVPGAADDPEFQARVGAFLQELQQLSWSIGRNVRIDIRWAGFKADVIRRHTAELVALAPDVILAGGDAITTGLQRATDSIPIVFTVVTDPIGAGLVASLQRPGGNITGFLAFEYGISTKWLELLREVAPHLTRAVVLRDPTHPLGLGMFGAIQGVAPLLSVEVSPVDVREASEIERAVAAFARSSNGGLITLPGQAQVAHRELIIALAARYRLPAVYPFRYHVGSGGLISYGPDTIDPFRRAAGYVDRILKGEKAADLPVQAPVKYELVVNLKTVKALGLELPATVLARADEVIE
jgi:putative ABC transport system substrate-binding protein